MWVLVVVAGVWVVTRFVRNIRAAQDRIDSLLADFDRNR